MNVLVSDVTPVVPTDRSLGSEPVAYTVTVSEDVKNATQFKLKITCAQMGLLKQALGVADAMKCINHVFQVAKDFADAKAAFVHRFGQVSFAA